jgi:hypothetical protein
MSEKLNVGANITYTNTTSQRTIQETTCLIHCLEDILPLDLII